MPITAFLEKNVDKIVEEEHFEKAVEQKLAKIGDDAYLTAPLELNVTIIRALGAYTTRTGSIEGLRWEESGKMPKEASRDRIKRHMTGPLSSK